MDQKGNEETAVKGTGLGIRHLQALLLFFGLVIAYGMRVNMSVAIVAMTDPSATDADVPTFPEWSKQIQDTILSSFFWGYLVLQIPAGMFAERFGGKILITLAMLINALVCFVLPFAAAAGGWQAVCACRVIQGLSQAALYPSMHGFQAKWSPITERSRFTTWVYSGAQLGTVIELSAAGFLGGSRFGWPSIFYSLGVLSIVWAGIWMFVAADSPRQHKWISDAERDYIESSAGQHKKKGIAPYKSIITSKPFIALVLAQMGQNWGFWTLLAEMPSYMKNVLGVDIKSNGLLSALPYFAMYLLSFPFGFASDYVINKGIFSRLTARKIANSISHWGATIFLIALSYVPAGNLVAAVSLLTVTIGINSSHYVGYGVNHIDLSPNYAPTLMGISNMMSNILSMLAPLAVGLILKDEKQASEWQLVFFISAGIFFLGNLAFVFFASADLQPWNEQNKTNDNIDIENKEEVATDKKSRF